MSILVHAPVPHLGKFKLPFDDAELMPHLRPRSGFVSVSAAFGLREIFGAWCEVGDGFRLAGVRRITPHPSLFRMKQIRGNLGIMYVGRSGNHRVDEFGAAVDVDVHTETPVIAPASTALSKPLPEKESWHIKIALRLAFPIL